MKEAIEELIKKYKSAVSCAQGNALSCTLAGDEKAQVAFETNSDTLEDVISDLTNLLKQNQ